MAIRKRPPWNRPPPKPEMMADTEGLCKTSRAAAFLDCTVRFVFTLIDRGELESVKVGRSRRIKWDSLRRYAGLPAPAKIHVHVDPGAMREMITDVVHQVLRNLEARGRSDGEAKERTRRR